jgi:hypothetical protein
MRSGTPGTGRPFRGVVAIAPTAMELVLAEIEPGTGLPGMSSSADAHHSHLGRLANAPAWTTRTGRHIGANRDGQGYAGSATTSIVVALWNKMTRVGSVPTLLT